MQSVFCVLMITVAHCTQRDVNCGGIVVEFQDEDGQILRRAFFLQYGEIYLPDAKPSPWDSRADFNLLVSHVGPLRALCIVRDLLLISLSAWSSRPCSPWSARATTGGP